MSNPNWIQVAVDLLQAIISGVFVGIVIYWLDERRGKRERRLSDYRIASNWDATESKVSLRNFDLTKANLSGLKFAGANLERAVIREANMWATDFSEAVLREVDFRKSKIIAAKFKEAIAFSVDFSRATISVTEDKDPKKRPDFTNAILRGAKFIGTKLSGVVMVGANLRDADFTEAILWDCDFTGADLTNSKWKRVKRVENCVWDDVKMNGRQTLPIWLLEEIRAQNSNMKKTRKSEK